MPREAIDWSRLDQKLRHFSRCGIPIRRQALRLGISERSIKLRRSALGIVRDQSAKKKETAHGAC